MAKTEIPKPAPKPDPKPAPTSAHVKKGQLPSAEVQALADEAMTAWNSGGGVDVHDSTGADWLFRVEREDQVALGIYRTPPDGGEPVSALVSQREFGVEDPRPKLASMILALAEPA